MPKFCFFLGKLEHSRQDDIRYYLQEINRINRIIYNFNKKDLEGLPEGKRNTEELKRYKQENDKFLQEVSSALNDEPLKTFKILISVIEDCYRNGDFNSANQLFFRLSLYISCNKGNKPKGLKKSGWEERFNELSKIFDPTKGSVFREMRNFSETKQQPLIYSLMHLTNALAAYNSEKNKEDKDVLIAQVLEGIKGFEKREQEEHQQRNSLSVE